MDVGLLVVRVVVGLLIAGHGAQKLFGWFGGGGVAGTGRSFDSLGYRPGRRMAVLAGVSELAGGVFLAVGFFTPLAGAAVVGIMVNAIVAAHSGNGPWAVHGGWELELTYAVVAAGVAFTGPGRYSLDHAFDWALTGTAWGITTAVVGIYAALIVLAVRALGRDGMRSTLGQAS